MVELKRGTKEVYLRREQAIFPFRERGPLKSGENFFAVHFFLEGVGKGEIVLNDTQDANVRSLTCFLRNKGNIVIFPYGDNFSEAIGSPCEVDITFSSPFSQNLPVCALEFSSSGLKLFGFPEPPHEKILLYEWVNEKGQRCVPLIPNQARALHDIKIRFLSVEKSKVAKRYLKNLDGESGQRC